MIEYSKNIPRPFIKKPEVEGSLVENPSRWLEGEEGLNQLQVYEMKNEQLKRVLDKYNKY